jgi:uncharacterized membrane protein YhaH (DUF805 family)
MIRHVTGPVEAVRTGLIDSFWQPEGRARRSEYWWFQGFLVLVYVVLALMVALVDSLLLFLLALAIVTVPHVTSTIRRLHDTDRSGAWYLVSFIPVVGSIWLLVLLLQDSGPDNEYGPSEKYGAPSPTPA